MMPRERISFEREIKDKNPNGSAKKLYEVIQELNCVPAERRKFQPITGNGVNAKEEFMDVKIVLWCRYYYKMEEAYRIQYNNKYYRILDVNRRFQDDTCLITCAKIDI